MGANTETMSTLSGRQYLRVFHDTVKNRLSKYDRKLFAETGCVSCGVVGKLLEGIFSKGYYTQLVKRGRINGLKLGSTYYVDLVRAIDYATVKPVETIAVKADGSKREVNANDLGLS